MKRNWLVSAGYKRKVIRLTCKELRQYAGRVLSIYKQMFFQGFPYSSHLDFALEEEKKIRICGYQPKKLLNLIWFAIALIIVLLIRNLGR